MRKSYFGGDFSIVLFFMWLFWEMFLNSEGVVLIKKFFLMELVGNGWVYECEV